MKWWLLVLVVVAGACNSNGRVVRYYNFSGEEWPREECCEFETNLPESGVYDIDVAVRHTVDLPYSEIWCAVTMRSDSSDWVVDTLRLPMMDSLGFWLGSGNSVKTVTLPITEQGKFFHSGVVRVCIEHLGEGTIPGVSAAGVEFRVRSEE
ncbi:MAG: gliding motility lipoprotein GldH [Marinifilaceae bacterium]|nr:gliding motility lipoprotein GldH [Marinifilaceae bacterium]